LEYAIQVAAYQPGSL